MNAKVIASEKPARGAAPGAAARSRAIRAIGRRRRRGQRRERRRQADRSRSAGATSSIRSTSRDDVDAPRRHGRRVQRVASASVALDAEAEAASRIRATSVVRHVAAPSTRAMRDARSVQRRGAPRRRIRVDRARRAAVPAPICCEQRSARARCRAAAASMSAPRSKRDDASVFRPSRLLVRRTDAGSKYALSSTIVAWSRRYLGRRRRPSRRRSPAAARASAITSISGVERAVDAVERRDASRPACARADPRARRPARLRQVERVHRLAESRASRSW